MASNAVDPSEPPRIKDYFFKPMIDTAPAAQRCQQHADAQPRRVMRTAWICPGCVRQQARA